VLRVDMRHTAQKNASEQAPWVYRLFLHPMTRASDHSAGLHVRRKMSERQRRADIGTANAVTRGVNIFAVRNRSLAQNYMEYKQVPPLVIRRVLDNSSPRRTPSADQVISEAIIPSSRTHAGD
jgi:hypothetical protein